MVGIEIEGKTIDEAINNLRKKKDAQSDQTQVYVKGSAKPGAKALEKTGK